MVFRSSCLHGMYFTLSHLSSPWFISWLRKHKLPHSVFQWSVHFTLCSFYLCVIVYTFQKHNKTQNGNPLCKYQGLPTSQLYFWWIQYEKVSLCGETQVPIIEQTYFGRHWLKNKFRNMSKATDPGSEAGLQTLCTGSSRGEGSMQDTNIQIFPFSMKRPGDRQKIWRKAEVALQIQIALEKH